jgi:hypothetical protein
MADYNSEDKPQPRREVVISDLRHNRDVEDIEETTEEAPVPAPAAETVAPEAPAQDAQVAERAVQEAAEAATGAEGTTLPAADGVDIDQDATSADIAANAGDGGEQIELPPGVTEEDLRQAEEQLMAAERIMQRQFFAMGVTNYLRYQLSMVLNFALLSMGSAPDPNTGLVTKNLPNAKLAIDVLEFLVLRLQNEMQPAERQQMTGLVSELKYAFMQAAQDNIPGTPGGIPGGGTQGEA